MLPEFFKDEVELRCLWSDPDTRKALLAGLADKGFGRAPLAEMQAVIEAENCDLFDVLAYVAFVDFVLAQYVRQGVDELDGEQLSPLLRLKYNNALNDAFAELGQPDQVRQLFVGFQKHLYRHMTAS